MEALFWPKASARWWNAESLGWRSAFLLTGVPGLVLAVTQGVLLQLQRVGAQAVPAADAAVLPTTGNAGFLDLLRYRNVVLAACIAAYMGSWILLQVTFVPQFLVKVRGLSSSSIGAVMSVICASGCIASLALPLASNRLKAYCSDRRRLRWAVDAAVHALAAARTWLVDGGGWSPVAIVAGTLMTPLAGRLADTFTLALPVWMATGAAVLACPFACGLWESAPLDKRTHFAVRIHPSLLGDQKQGYSLLDENDCDRASATLHLMDLLTKLSSQSDQITRRPIRAQIHEKLGYMINQGLLRPGDELPSERRIAETLGVSRETVRSALAILREEGMISIAHGTSTVVIGPSAPGLAQPATPAQALARKSTPEQIFEARVKVVGEVARLAALRMSKDVLDHLRSLVKEQQDLVRDPVGFQMSDVEFHMNFYEACGNPLLFSFAADLYATSLDTRRKAMADKGATARSVLDHRAIVAALEVRDPELTEQAAVAQLERIHGRGSP